MSFTRYILAVLLAFSLVLAGVPAQAMPMPDCPMMKAQAQAMQDCPDCAQETQDIPDCCKNGACDALCVPGAASLGVLPAVRAVVLFRLPQAVRHSVSELIPDSERFDTRDRPPKSFA